MSAGMGGWLVRLVGRGSQSWGGLRPPSCRRFGVPRRHSYLVMCEV